jgi:hypothetical protein
MVLIAQTQMNLKNGTQNPVEDLRTSAFLSLGAFVFFAVMVLAHTPLAFKFRPCGQSVFAMRAWIIIYSFCGSATLVAYSLTALPKLEYPVEQGLSEETFQGIVFLQKNYLNSFKMSALLLQTFVGTIYAVFIYGMCVDYWGTSNGLIANHVTQKERAARESQEGMCKYLAGSPTLMKVSSERKWRNLKRFFCRKQVPSLIVTEDIAPPKRRPAPPKKETKPKEVAPESTPEGKKHDGVTKSSEEIK